MDALPAFAADAPFFVVLNAGSGKDDVGEQRRIIEQVLGDGGRRCEVLQIEPDSNVHEVAGRAVARAGEEGGAVIAAGGDGTINAVAQAVLGSGRVFGVIPQGTFNYFSRTHGIPSDTADATRALLHARVRPAQAGLVNDKLFLVNASLGLYPKILEDREESKQRFGRNRVVAFVSAVVTIFRAHRPLRFRLTGAGVDRDVRSPTLFIANNALQLEQMGIADPALDGDLVAMTSSPVGSLTLVRMLLQGAIGRLEEAGEITHFKFESLEVRPTRVSRDGKVKVATDGEICWLDAPLSIRVSPEALALLVPRPDEAAPRE